MHKDTLLLHGVPGDPRAPGPFQRGPQFSATFVAPGEPAEQRYTYGRFHNPTWSDWEAALAVLEGGEVVAFASGMAAVDAVLGTCLRPGDALVLPSDAYYTTRLLAAEWVERLGGQVRLEPTAGEAQARALAGARLLWIETPSNPELSICDVAALARAARDAGVLVAVDNTTATVLLQQPLALGATFSVASDTKALCGHGDVVLGHVATTDAEWAKSLRTWRTRHGAIPGPMEVWLAQRSLGTAALRLERQCANARAVAERLAARQDVGSVLWPGLPAHPGHATAQRQMSDFGCVVGFDVGTRARAERFLGGLRIVLEATSFGGIRSTAERRMRWGGDAVGEGFVRFSAGCEAAEDLVADLLQALERARP